MTEEILEETALAPSELIELFKHRSATYGLLSRLYAAGGRRAARRAA